MFSEPVRRIGLGSSYGHDPEGRGFAAAAAKLESLKRKTVLAIVVNHPAIFTSLADGLLCGAFGTVGLLHDLFSQLVIAKLPATMVESLSHIAGIYLMAALWGDRYRAVARKPETLRVKFQ